MPPAVLDSWNERLRNTFRGYDEPLLRQVAGKLCKPRNQWPVEELIDRCLDTVVNPAVLDRRLKDLEPAGQMVLALIAHSRQPRWQVGNLIEMLVTLGQPDGLEPIQNLFEAGLLYPEFYSNGRIRLRTFAQWLAQGNMPLWVYAHPQVTARALSAGLKLPDYPAIVVKGADTGTKAAPVVHEADGLEWPLRLAALWQQVATAPLRRTQQRDFFKRDLDRLHGDPLLTAVPADNLDDLPDPGLLTVALALEQGVLKDDDGVLTANSFPEAWQQGFPAAIASLWSALPHLDSWNAEHGWQPRGQAGNPYPSAYLLAVLLLAKLPEGSWASAAESADWIIEHHPYWGSGAQSACDGIKRFLLGVAFQLRMIQAAKDTDGAWLIRLSPLGRWVLGVGPLPPATPPFPQTWLVQPNLEILVYRQGLSPDLIARLSRFAVWKTLGAACTMQLEPDTVYRALEGGETFTTIVQVLERHGMKALPPPVLEALKTWSNKRERISIYPSAALFEFADAAAMQDALARGLPAVRLTDRLAVVADESAIDYRNFRLTATRDYCLPLEKCVTVEDDGVTLTIDQARSDLLLETELQRFAEPAPRDDGRQQYRITPASLSSGRQQGLSLSELESWFMQRTGQPLSPAVRLLLIADEVQPAHFRRQVVLHVGNADIADGLEQWPGTRALIQERLGPTALVVVEEDVAKLSERLAGLGMKVDAR